MNDNLVGCIYYTADDTTEKYELGNCNYGPEIKRCFAPGCCPHLTSIPKGKTKITDIDRLNYKLEEFKSDLKKQSEELSEAIHNTRMDEIIALSSKIYQSCGKLFEDYDKRLSVLEERLQPCETAENPDAKFTGYQPNTTQETLGDPPPTGSNVIKDPHKEYWNTVDNALEYKFEKIEYTPINDSGYYSIIYRDSKGRRKMGFSTSDLNLLSERLKTFFIPSDNQ